MISYGLLVEHTGHKLSIKINPASEYQSANATIICETCNLGPLIVVNKPGSRAMKLKPGKPFPKSATQGGKVK